MEVLKSILGLLQHHPQDAEVRLMLATMYRHRRRASDARAQLALLCFRLNEMTNAQNAGIKIML